MPRVQRATGPRLLLGSGTAGSRTREPVERKSDAVTITPPSHLGSAIGNHIWWQINHLIQVEPA